jgi:superfamily II DNA or RNA helicase
MSSMLDVVRKACLPAIWSQGAKLARESAVQATPTANEYRVRAPGLAVAPTVTLYSDDEEWSCDCGSKVDPCAHVAAAAIAAAQGSVASGAPSGGESASPSTGAGARVGYRLAVRDRRLALTRSLVHADGKEERLVGSLATLVARAKLPPGLAPTHDDMRLDRIFGDTTKDAVPLARMSDVLEALATASDVTLDGTSVKTSSEPVKPRGVVEDADGGGFVVRVERDPDVTAVVAMGVVRVGEILRPVGEPELSGEWLEHLPLVRRVANLSELAAKIVPELEKKIEVDVRTARLPRTDKRARPRIDLDLSHQGHALSVLPILVYGDPPIARLDGDSLVVLRGSVVPERKREQERELLAKLRDRLNLVPGRRIDFDGAEAIAFAAKLRGWQSTEGGGAALGEARRLVPRVTVEGDRFDVVFEAENESGADRANGGAPPTADPASVLRAFRDGLDLVPTSDGGWAPVPREWLAQHGSRIADLLAARDREKRLATAALPELGALCRALELPPPVGLDRLAPLLAGGGAIPAAKLPGDLEATLREYQREGIDWLSFLRDAALGGILADDMGLGKTLQTIAALRGRTLVVCPKSVVYNWADEIARFRPGLRASIYHGQRRELDRKADVTLTTYAVLRLDIEALEKEQFDVVVLDEAQAIKNETSQTARAAFRLRGAFRVALSGTPVENRLEELWSLMFFANPGLLGGRSDFHDRIAGPIAAGEAGAAERLRTKIRPFVLRRLKRDVLRELPPRTDVLLHVELDEKERAIYDAVRAATKKEIVERVAAGSGGVLAALEALLRLRQAACHAALVPGQQAENSSKVERLLEALEEAAADGHKALVFSQWTSLLDLIEPHLRAAGVAFTRLDGSTRDRAAVVAEFQNESGPPVMLVSLKAGGTGLNLTAADHVFLLDPWWNPAVEDQAADRAHRIGQERPVMVYRLVAKETVEERILALKEKKRALADAALGGAETGASITKDDLLALLE